MDSSVTVDVSLIPGYTACISCRSSIQCSKFRYAWPVNPEELERHRQQTAHSYLFITLLVFTFWKLCLPFPHNYMWKYVKSCRHSDIYIFHTEDIVFQKITVHLKDVNHSSWHVFCGNGKCLTATRSSFVNHRFGMIHRTHTSLQLWGWKWWSAQMITLSTHSHRHQGRRICSLE